MITTKRIWPQPGDLGFVKTDRNTRSLNHLVIAARDFNGVPIQPSSWSRSSNAHP